MIKIFKNILGNMKVSIKDIMDNFRITQAELEKRVLKVEGKGLSDENFTRVEKQKLHALSNANLLIDGGFQVWQEGTSFNNFGVYNQYTATMWLAKLGTNRGQGVEVSKTTDGIKITCTNIPTEKQSTGIQYQHLDYTYLNGKTVILSYRARKITETTELFGGKTGIAPTSTSFETYSETFVWSEYYNTRPIRCLVYCNALGDGVEIDWVKLELGEVATPFIEDNYTDVLTQTNYYFQKYASLRKGTLFLGSTKTSSWHDGIYFSNMRVAPTVSITAKSLVAGDSTEITVTPSTVTSTSVRLFIASYAQALPVSIEQNHIIFDISSITLDARIY